MRCARCNFENIPDQARCIKCGSILQGEEERVDVYPPRMPRWKKPVRRLFRWGRQQKVVGEEGVQLRVPGWMKIMSGDCFLGLLLSIVPGLAHLAGGRFREIRWYLLIWFVLLVTGVFCYGSGFSFYLLALAIGLHAWIAVHHKLIKELAGIGVKLFVTAVLVMVLILVYRAIPRLVFGLRGGYTSLTVPYHNISRGDYLLARRRSVLRGSIGRGSLVVTRLSGIIYGDGRRMPGRGESMVVEIVGLPGEYVETKDNSFIVDEQQLDTKRYPVPIWLRGRRISVRIPQGCYFISTEYSIRGRGASDEVVRRACLVQAADIEAVAFMNWWPLSRRGFIRSD
jgi:hypothetical protein